MLFLFAALALIALAAALRARAAAADTAARLDRIDRRLRQLEAAVDKRSPVARERISAAPADSAPRPVAAAPAASAAPAPVPIVPPVQRPAASSIHVHTVPAETLEARIGSRWMLVAGVVVLVLGVAFFVKYAFDRHWINETMRVVIGTASGIAVWLAGLQFARRGYAPFGRMIAGAGLAMLFVSAWASVALYRLVSEAVGFVWIVGVSVLAGATAEREKSAGLSLVALTFAYAAPFVIPTNRDRHVALFTYDGAVTAAVLGLVRRHGWPALGITSFWFVWTTYAVWSARFYRGDLFFSTELFLTVTVGLLIAMLRVYRARTADRSAQAAVYVLAIAPVLYHIASVLVLFRHGLWFISYLIAVSAVAIGLAKDRPQARMLAWIATAAPLVAWIGEHAGTRPWLAPALLGVAAIYGLHLIGQLRGLAAVEPLPAAEIALFHVNSVGAFFMAYLAVDARGGPTTLLAVGAAIWNFVLARAARARVPSVFPHALGAAFTLTTAAIAIALSGPWITAAYAAEGFAILWFGLYSKRGVFRLGGAVLIAFAVMRLISLQFDRTPASFTPVLNARTLTGALIVALLFGVARLYDRYETDGAQTPEAIATATVAANLLTVGLITADIASYWKVREAQLTADFARQLSVSVAWGLYAMGAIVVGFARQSTTLRYLALALFGLTVLKMFAVDLLELDGIYRIAGFTAMGVVLLAASFFYQRYRPDTGHS